MKFHPRKSYALAIGQAFSVGKSKLRIVAKHLSSNEAPEIWTFSRAALKKT